MANSFFTKAATNESTTVEQNKQYESFQKLLTDVNVKRAVLTDVNGGVGEGIAHTSRKGGKLSQYVYASNLADLPKNYWYEAWLVQSASPQKITSLGRLTKLADSTYAVFYTSDKELLGYDLVVVTRETSTKKYEGQGTHILEGLAQ